MIYLKQLSGDYLTIDTSEALECGQILSRLSHPCVVLLRDFCTLLPTDVIPDESEVSILFQSYHLYFVWKGGKNSVWPGDYDKTYCIDCSTMERVEWCPEAVTECDTIAVDLLSFGLYTPYISEIKELLSIARQPIDIDFLTLQQVLACDCAGTERVTLFEFLSTCPHNGRELHSYTLERLYRTKFISGQRFTREEWWSRITQARERGITI